MSMFSNVESDESSSGGFLSRLRGWRTGFTETSPAKILPVSEPRFETENRAANPQLMTLGMRLRNGDVTDVEANEHEGVRPVPRVTPVAEPDVGAI